MADLREIERQELALQRMAALRVHFAEAINKPDMRLSDFGVLSDDVDVLYELVNDRYWELRHDWELRRGDTLHTAVPTSSDGRSGNADPRQ